MSRFKASGSVGVQVVVEFWRWSIRGGAHAVAAGGDDVDVDVSSLFDECW